MVNFSFSNLVLKSTMILIIWEDYGKYHLGIMFLGFGSFHTNFKHSILLHVNDEQIKIMSIILCVVYYNTLVSYVLVKS